MLGGLAHNEPVLHLFACVIKLIIPCQESQHCDVLSAAKQSSPSSFFLSIVFGLIAWKNKQQVFGNKLC